MKTIPYRPVRMRRLRHSDMLRDMVAETTLSPANFVAPLFVRRGENIRRPILSMPGQFQLSPDIALDELGEMASRGIKAYILFGVVDPADKDDRGTHACDPDNAVCTTLRLARDAGIQMLAITDLCFCEYTSHGHCGVLARDSAKGRKSAHDRKKKSTSGRFVPPDAGVLNDETNENLARQAVLHAQAGADIIAPSGMMDHCIAVVRAALDRAGFPHKSLLGYAVKYASSFYGPFREAAESPPQFGDRRGYQMDFRRGAREAIREAKLDVQEGADMVMVKPAMPYLDILRAVADAVDVPCAAYQVSGEYAMFKAAASAGWIDERQCVLETMHAFRRAGASFIITYYANEVLEWLGN